MAGWHGHLVVDDYAGDKGLFGAGVTEVGCIAHARCRFFELQVADQSPIAGEALRRISELYEIQSPGRNLANGERQSLREREAWPKLQATQDWLQRTRDTATDGGSLARAMDYSLKRWPALSRYARSAILPIANNSVENIIRPIALGKKNWLFAGSERSGRSATAELNDLDPAAWLKDTLKNPLAGRIAASMSYGRWRAQTE